jgi:23S rRNA (cytidine1920-2'-O)/16S rRNA (cytidine1409-2'-O)-methyltransferase
MQRVSLLPSLPQWAARQKPDGPDPVKNRADLVLVTRGFFDSRARAQAAIAAGLVSADGTVVRKASEQVSSDALILAEAPHPYVSRGGLKLVAGLDHFGFDPTGQHCLDVGASTGGFTDVLLKRGAAHVTAIDTGKGQLHTSLMDDRRVASFESSDVRRFESGLLARPPGLIVVDVSFISLVLVLPAITALAAPGAALVALIKPQFEVGKARIERGGIVKDEAAIAEVCARIETQLASLGWQVLGLIDSPVTGGDGNREFLVGARA